MATALKHQGRIALVATIGSFLAHGLTSRGNESRLFDYRYSTSFIATHRPSSDDFISNTERIVPTPMVVGYHVSPAAFTTFLAGKDKAKPVREPRRARRPTTGVAMRFWDEGAATSRFR